MSPFAKQHQIHGEQPVLPVAEVHAMWAAFGEACEIVKLSQLAEAQSLFAEFAPLAV